MEYVDNQENNNENTDINNLISQLEYFKDNINDSEWFYRNIYYEIKNQLKYNNIKIEINFNMLEIFYPRLTKEDTEIGYENMYIPKRCNYFIEKQLKVLEKLDF